jgi:hypothetical protein
MIVNKNIEITLPPIYFLPFVILYFLMLYKTALVSFKIKKPGILFPGFCAAKEIRTPKSFRTLPPQSSASTNFAIAAFGVCKFNKTDSTTTYVFNIILKVVPFPGSDVFTNNCPL